MANLLSTTITTTSGNGLTITTNDVSTLKMTSSAGGVKNWGFATTNLAASDFGIYQSNAAGGDPISAGSPKLYFNGAGNVGIGTTAPANALDVKSFIRIDTYEAGTTVPNTSGFLRILSSGKTGWANNDELGKIEFFGTDGSGIGPRNLASIRAINSTGNGTTTTVSNGELAFYTSALNALESEKVRITSAGNVGIGTTAPSQKLTVVGNARFEAASGNRYVEVVSSTSSIQIGTEGSVQFIYGVGAFPMTFSTNTSERMRITSAGNVGIGTTAPGGRLHIATPDPATNFVAIDFRNPTYGIYGKSNSIAGRGNTLEFTATDYNTSGSVVTREVLTLRPEGNVGIGTTSPSAPLHVYKNVGAGDYVAYIQNTGAGNGLKIYNADWDTTDYLLYATNGGTSTYGYSFVVDGNSRVGIGTTTPAYKLDVSSDIRIGEGLTMSPNGGALYGVDGALSYYSSTNGVYLNGAGTSGWLRLNASGVQNDENSINIYGRSAGAYMNFRTNNSERMRITSSGRLLVNTTTDLGSPYSIQVNGRIVQYGLEFAFVGDEDKRITVFSNRALTFATNDTERMRISGAGNVAIGVTNPHGQLSLNNQINNGSTPVSSYPAGSSTGLGQNFFKSYYAANSDGLGSYPRYFDIVSTGFPDGTNGGSNIRFFTNPIADNSPAVPRMVITSAGNVGIGTTAPINKFAVITSNTFGYYNRTEAIGVFQGAQPTLLIANDGNSDNQYAELKLGNNQTSYYSHSAFVRGVQGTGIDYYRLEFGTANGVAASTKMTIGSNGNVGIGTTAPGQKLQVIGNIGVGDGTYNGGVYANSTTSAVDVNWGFDFLNTAGQKDYSTRLKYYPVTGDSRKGGIWNSSSDTWVLYGDSNNTPNVIIPSGNVGIGTTDPGTKLDVIGNLRVSDGTDSGYVYFRRDRSDVYIGENAFQLTMGAPSGVVIETDSNSNGFSSFNVTRNTSSQFYIADNGNVGIGTTSPGEKLDVSGNARTSGFVLVNNHSDNTLGYRIANTSGTSVSAMFTNSSNALVIAAGAVDQINLNKKVLVNAVALGVNFAPSATAGRIDASNDIVAFNSSDERLKENITPIANALDKVKSLTGVEFDWKPEHKEAHGHEGRDTGIIAQQVLAVMPTAVRTNDTGYLAVRYEKLIGLLIEGMKEQQEQIDVLKAKLDGLTK